MKWLTTYDRGGEGAPASRGSKQFHRMGLTEQTVGKFPRLATVKLLLYQVIMTSFD